MKSDPSVATTSYKSATQNNEHNDVACIKEEICDADETILDNDIGEMLVKVEETQMIQQNDTIDYTYCDPGQCSKDHTMDSHHYTENQPVQSNSEAHIKINPGEKLFKCNQCNKTCTQRSNLQMHMRIHTGEKPFKCKQCNKAFTQSSSLQNHIRIHTGEKPFKCNHCNKTFAARSSLQSHIRIHTGEKPFKCKHCVKTFSKSCNLQRHVNTHTEDCGASPQILEVQSCALKMVP